MSAYTVHKSDELKRDPTLMSGLARHSACSESATGRLNAGDYPRALAVVTHSSAPTPSEITQLIEDHIPLVGVLVAERLGNVPTHVRRDDLMSAGMMALVLSAGAYDPQRGVPFRSFAAYRIRGALIDELRAMDWASRSVRTRAREVEMIRARLATTQARPPSSEDIADALGISTRELDSMYVDLARGTVLSLEDVATDTLHETPSTQSGCPESLILHREQMGYLHDAIAALPERLRFVVLAYYFGQRQMSDIAVEMSVTQSRVSQMCSEATALIRDGMNSHLNPDALRPMALTGRAAATRKAYFQALADRNTVAGRLNMSTVQGEMRRSVYADQLNTSRQSRIA